MVPRSLRIAFVSIFAAVAILALSPLFTLAGRLFNMASDLSLLFDKSTLAALKVTLLSTLVSLTLALCLSIPTSWFLCRSDLPGRKFFRRVLLFPYLIPPYLLAIAWISLAVPKIGFLNRMLGEHTFNIYSFTGLCWVFATAYLPILLGPLCQAMDSMDPSLEEAARVCGARPLQVFLKISLPCATPAIAAASLLFALDVMSAFGIPALVGNPGRIFVLTTNIYNHAKMGGLQGTNEAFMVSLWLLAFTALFLAVNEWTTRKYSARLTSGKAPRQSLMALRHFRPWVFIIFVGLVFVVVVLPLGAVILNSFLVVAGDLRIKNFSTHNYEYLFQMPELFRAFMNSLELAVTTAVICVFIGFLIAYFKDRTWLRGRDFLNRMATVPFAVPGTVVALALLVSFGTGWGHSELSLLGSFYLLLLAYVLKYMALSVQALTPAMARIDPSLDEAARIAGAGVWRMLRSILFPLLLGSLGSIFLLTLLPVFSELTMSVLLTGPGLETMGTLLFQLQEYANPLAACSLASLIIISLIVLLPIIRRFGQGRVP